MVSLVRIELRLKESDSACGVCEASVDGSDKMGGVCGVSVDCSDSMGSLCPDVVDFLAYGVLHVDGINGEGESSCQEEEEEGEAEESKTLFRSMGFVVVCRANPYLIVGHVVVK
jgi:hypothetical protein